MILSNALSETSAPGKSSLGCTARDVGAFCAGAAPEANRHDIRAVASSTIILIVFCCGWWGCGVELLHVTEHRVEAEPGQALGEMRRQFGFDSDLAAIGVVDRDAPRMEVQLATDSAGQERRRTAIFAVADDRMADRRHVDAQLVGAPGIGGQFDPGSSGAGAFEHAIATARRHPFRLVDMHLFTTGAGVFRKR